MCRWEEKRIHPLLLPPPPRRGSLDRHQRGRKVETQAAADTGRFQAPEVDAKGHARFLGGRTWVAPFAPFVLMVIGLSAAVFPSTGSTTARPGQGWGVQTAASVQ